MVRSDRYKYCLYSHGERRESLVDMIDDHGEMTNLVDEKAHAKALAQHRAMLKEHGSTHGDQLALDMLDPSYVGDPFETAKPPKKKK